jgi:hypothetical protein
VGYGLGGRRELIAIRKGLDGWGWIKFAKELSKVKDFFAASVRYGSGFPASAEKKGVKEGPWLGTGPFVEVLRAEPSFYAMEKTPAEELGDPLVKAFDAGDKPLGKNNSNIPSIQGNGNCLFDDEDVRGGRCFVKRKILRLLRD